MTKPAILLTIAALLLGLAQARAGEADEVSGTWLTAAGDAKIRISPCASGLCGVIVWLKQPIDSATGKAQVDDKNSNKALAHRPILGLNIFSTMHHTGQRKWAGRIYNADNGKTYASELHPAGAKKLEVRGCVLSFLCGGETWTKVGEVTIASADPAPPAAQAPPAMQAPPAIQTSSAIQAPPAMQAPPAKAAE
jgi:uncharacterized protein (DUF2147 family)